MYSFKRKASRLPDYKYNTTNAYFITICTDKRKKLFWTDWRAVVDCPANVPLTTIGQIVAQCITAISIYYPTVTVDHCVIMPDHVHLLLQINPVQGVSSPSISTIINQMKGAASKKAGFSIWQKGFYDHVIRNQSDYKDAWIYIEGNPGKMNEDEVY